MFTHGEESGPGETTTFFSQSFPLFEFITKKIRYIFMTFIIYEFKKEKIKLSVPSPNLTQRKFSILLIILNQCDYFHVFPFWGKKRAEKLRSYFLLKC